MENILKYLNFGGLYETPNSISLAATKLQDMTDTLIPFLTKYPLLGPKRLDFADFVKATELMRVKSHLTEEGLEQIRIIKSWRPGMNRGRD